MSKWHETPAANLGLRVGGLFTLCLAVAIGITLYHQVHSHPVRDASLGELGLSTLFVLSMLTGAALLVVGPGLWKQIEVPGRRSFVLDDDVPTSIASDRRGFDGTNENKIPSLIVHEAPVPLRRRA